MAYLDSADLLERALSLSKAPAVSEDVGPDQWYRWLTEAQDYWTRIIAQHDPRLVCGPPTQLTSADGGYTYTFPTVPIMVEEITVGKAGTPVRIGADWDPTVELTWEGDDTLRIARNRSRTFTNGLWSRYIAQPGTIDASTEPSLPVQVRLLLVPRACVLWARSGSYRDPNAYLDEEQRLWSGDPRILGDTGILGALKKKAFMHTQRGQYAWPWWRTADLGR